ncbi:MAG: hypothetical protein SNI51_03390 [Rikenellaceae bacterium]
MKKLATILTIAMLFSSCNREVDLDSNSLNNYTGSIAGLSSAVLSADECGGIIRVTLSEDDWRLTGVATCENNTYTSYDVDSTIPYPLTRCDVKGTYGYVDDESTEKELLYFSTEVMSVTKVSRNEIEIDLNQFGYVNNDLSRVITVGVERNGSVEYIVINQETHENFFLDGFVTDRFDWVTRVVAFAAEGGTYLNTARNSYLWSMPDFATVVDNWYFIYDYENYVDLGSGYWIYPADGCFPDMYEDGSRPAGFTPELSYGVIEDNQYQEVVEISQDGFFKIVKLSNDEISITMEPNTTGEKRVCTLNIMIDGSSWTSLIFYQIAE